MRYRIASHAAKHGPNGCTTSKSPPLGMDEMTEELTAESGTRDTPSSSRGIMNSPEVQLAPVVLATSWDNVVFPQDYGEMLVRCSALCICSEGSSKRPPRSQEGKRGHNGDCLIPDKWFTVVKEHELPFRVTDFFRRSVKRTLFDPMHGGLVIQCLLMVGQAALDSLNPKFGFEPSDQALRLQHKALRAMQKVITKRHNMIDDNIVIASALMLLIAVQPHPSHACEFPLMRSRDFMPIKMPTGLITRVCKSLSSYEVVLIGLELMPWSRTS